MSRIESTRRSFLKKAGLGALVGVARVARAEKPAAGTPPQPGRIVCTTAPARQLAEAEVLVVGAGPAGIGAALAAARKGVRTMLIERHAFFGGIASFCTGMNINQMRPDGKTRSHVHELFITKLLAYGDSAAQVKGHSVRCNVEYLKVAVLDALEQVGCKYLVHTQAVDAVMEAGRVAGVTAGTKKGLAVIRAGVVVDCTGDADIACFSGAETLFDKDNSPMTLALNVTNFDAEKVKESDFKSALKKARQEKEYSFLPGNCLLQHFPSRNVVMINHHGTRAYGPLDGTDAEQLTAAESFSRRQVLQMVSAFRRFGGEGLKEVELVCTGPQIGVRETRRIKGVYVLTEDDAQAGRRFEDVVAWRSGKIDVGGGVYDAEMQTHDVPYRAILPEKIDGLLAAGRCISTTHIAHSAGKSMGNCMATGHAAGLAAAMSVQRGCLPRELKVGELQDALRADGVDLERTQKPA